MAITVLYLAREIFIPLSLALLLGFLLSPLVRRLERWHMRRSVAVAVVLVCALAGAGDIVLISALPPFALLSARTASKKAHSEHPKAEIIIGLWQFSSDVRKAAERLDKVFPDPVVTTLSGAIARVESGSGASDLDSRRRFPLAV